MSQLGTWVGGCHTPPPPRGGRVGHLSVCGYAKILGGWVPELTPPPGWLSKTLLPPSLSLSLSLSLSPPPPSLSPSLFLQQPYECRVAHAHLQCPCLWQSVIAGMGEIARICVGHVRRGVAVRQVWGGLQLQGHGVTVLLVWMPPRHSAWNVRCMQQAHITLWPIFPASVPSGSVTEALKILSAEVARHLCMRIMNAQARYIWYTANPSPESEVVLVAACCRQMCSPHVYRWQVPLRTGRRG